MKCCLLLFCLFLGCSTADKVSVAGAVTGFAVGSLICPPATSIIGATYGGALGPLYDAREKHLREQERKAKFEPFESVIEEEDAKESRGEREAT